LLVGAAVGVKQDTVERTSALLAAGADVIVIDVAHGHNIRAIETTALLRKTFGTKIEIIAGNIATPEAARDLAKAGADGLKVGIGPGAACTTRIVTGVGVPQLTAIMDVAKEAEKLGIPFIADGGIKNSGDLSKALAAGGNTAMIGNLLAGTKESPGEYILDRGSAYKYYRGMASYDATSEKVRVDRESGTRPDEFFRSPEGASGRVSYRGEAAMVIADLIGGLRSSMSYLGATTLEDFHKNAEFIRMTDGGLRESGPHGVK
jgi:IMP dehydrogenase